MAGKDIPGILLVHTPIDGLPRIDCKLLGYHQVGVHDGAWSVNCPSTELVVLTAYI
jgi:hypothetical protein